MHPGGLEFPNASTSVNRGGWWWKFDLNIMSFVTTTTTACCDRGRNVTQDQEEAIVKWRRALSVVPQQYIRPRNISIITTTVNNNRFGQFFLARGTISCAASVTSAAPFSSSVDTIMEIAFC